MNKRNEGISIAVISEGDTEAWYFKQLSRKERVYINTYPKEGKSISSLYNKAIELLQDEIYDFIFGLVDLDKNSQTKLQKLKSLSTKHNNFHLIRSQPCFEYWFYLHNKKYSGRYFSTWENENSLKPEILKIIKKYEKSKKFYNSKGGQGIYSFLRQKLINACSNSLKLFKDKNTKSKCEIFHVVGIIFCSKFRISGCTHDKFFKSCIRQTHLCDNLKKTL